MPELLSFVLVGLWIYCLIDIVTSNRDEVRNLPKWAWFVLAVVIPPIGVLTWFLLGRPPHADGAARERWAPGARPPRQQTARRSRPTAAERVEDEAAVRARIEERDAQLARWAEEDRRRSQGDGPRS